MSTITRFLFTAAGVFCLLNGAFISLTSNLNLGNILTLLLGFVLSAVGIFHNKFKEFFPKWLKISFFAILAFVLVFSSSLYLYGKSDNADFKEDAVIVLGAGLRGERPSSSLKGRLNAAYEYHKNNPNALIVVSGGKGHDEDISEAEAMERYLVNLGVPSEKIIKEDKSTSTFENFKFSKQFLDSHFNKDYRIVYITNDYHVFRAGKIAESAGFESTSHMHSGTIWHSILPGVLRECLAVLKFFILGN